MIRYTTAHELRWPNGNGCLDARSVYDLAHNLRHSHPEIAQASVNKIRRNLTKCELLLRGKKFIVVYN